MAMLRKRRLALREFVVRTNLIRTTPIGVEVSPPASRPAWSRASGTLGDDNESIASETCAELESKGHGSPTLTRRAVAYLEQSPVDVIPGLLLTPDDKHSGPPYQPPAESDTIITTRAHRRWLAAKNVSGFVAALSDKHPQNTGDVVSSAEHMRNVRTPASSDIEDRSLSSGRGLARCASYLTLSPESQPDDSERCLRKVFSNASYISVPGVLFDGDHGPGGSRVLRRNDSYTSVPEGNHYDSPSGICNQSPRPNFDCPREGAKTHDGSYLSVPDDPTGHSYEVSQSPVAGHDISAAVSPTVSYLSVPGDSGGDNQTITSPAVSYLSVPGVSPPSTASELTRDDPQSGITPMNRLSTYALSKQVSEAGIKSADDGSVAVRGDPKINPSDLVTSRSASTESRPGSAADREAPHMVESPGWGLLRPKCGARIERSTLDSLGSAFQTVTLIRDGLDVGFGFGFRASESNHKFVTKVFEHSIADRAGVVAGAEIISLNTVDADKVSQADLVEACREAFRLELKLKR